MYLDAFVYRYQAWLKWLVVGKVFSHENIDACRVIRQHDNHQPKYCPSFYSTILNTTPGQCLGSWLQGTALGNTYRHVTSNRRGRVFPPMHLFLMWSSLFRASLSSCVHLPHQPQRPNQSLGIELRSLMINSYCASTGVGRKGKSSASHRWSQDFRTKSGFW